MTSPDAEASHAPLLVARARLEELLPILQTFRLPSAPVVDLNGPPGSAISSVDLPGLKKLAGAVAKEIESIDKLIAAPPPDKNDPPKAAPALNAPHLLGLSDAAYGAPYPVLGLNQTFPTMTGKLTVSRAKGKANQVPSGPDVKVHVVADGGNMWIRVIAITNIRLLFEFYESDSYINSDSSFSDSDNDDGASSSSSPSPPNGLNPAHLRTTLHKTASQLLQAASLLSPPPKVQIQLPRLRPEDDTDGRVQRTIDELRSLGVDVVLHTSPPYAGFSFKNPPPSPSLRPTRHLNLDLSVLIALASAIVHSPLPSSGLAEGVYKPLIRRYNKDGTARTDQAIAAMGGTDNWRALTMQLESEIAAPLVDEIVDVLSRVEGGRAAEDVVFWATKEAKQRLGMIVGKLGGPLERRRAEEMWFDEALSGEESEERARRCWDSSRCKDRVGKVHLALASIRTGSPMGSPSPETTSETATPSTATAAQSPRSAEQATPAPYQTLNSALAKLDLTATPPSSLTTNSHSSSQPLAKPFSFLHPYILRFLLPSSSPDSLKPPPSLTPHTLRTLLFGLERNMTTLSANRASWKSLWKVMEGEEDPSLGVWGGEGEEERERRDAIGWVVEPRSLGESMVME